MRATKWIASMFRPRSFGLGLLAVGGLVAGGARPAEAALLSYEPFDYTVGSDVLGQNGGGGWTGAWRAHAGGAVPVGSFVTGTGSLAGPSGLPTQGNHAIMSGEFGTTQPARDYSDFAGTDGTRLYYSFIGQRLGNPVAAANEFPRGANAGLFDTTHPTRPERVGVGNSSNAATNAWSIIPEGSGANRVASSEAFSTLAWQVLRIDFVGDATTPDNAYLFINPDPAVEPDISAAAAQSLGAFAFSNTDFVRAFVGNTSGASPYAVMIIDEIRLGTDYAAMSSTQVVPEPVSSLAIAGLGVAGLFYRRLRSRALESTQSA